MDYSLWGVDELNDQQFEQRWVEIHKENVKKAKENKPKKVDPMVKTMQDFDTIVTMSVGILTSPKLSSQQQIKSRKSFENFASKMVVFSDPLVAEQLATEIYYSELKQKMMDKMKND